MLWGVLCGFSGFPEVINTRRQNVLKKVKYYTYPILFLFFLTTKPSTGGDIVGDDLESEHDSERHDDNDEKQAENEQKKNGSEENVAKKDVQVKIEVKLQVEENKALSPEEMAAEERKKLAESYRKHKIDSHPTEEFWVPPVRTHFWVSLHFRHII